MAGCGFLLTTEAAHADSRTVVTRWQLWDATSGGAAGHLQLLGSTKGRNQVSCDVPVR